jgi:hypothetical protein
MSILDDKEMYFEADFFKKKKTQAEIRTSYSKNLMNP